MLCRKHDTQATSTTWELCELWSRTGYLVPMPLMRYMQAKHTVVRTQTRWRAFCPLGISTSGTGTRGTLHSATML